MSDNEGVFNFNEDFPGPHMIRVRLRKHQAWEVMRQLAIRLKDKDEVVDFAWFGTLRRDAEEDKGNPIDLDILTDHDWLQIEQAAMGGVSGISDEWPDLVKAIEKVRNRKLMRQSSAWLRGFCEALVLSR